MLLVPPYRHTSCTDPFIGIHRTGNVQLHIIEQKYAENFSSAWDKSGAATGNVPHYAYECHNFALLERRLREFDKSGKLARIGSSFAKNVCVDSHSRTMISQVSGRSRAAIPPSVF